MGGEVSVDNVLNSGFDEVYGITGRAGIKVTDDARIFVAGGHSFGNGDSWHAGIGGEHNRGSSVYAKLEHRRNFTNFGFDFDTTVIGFVIKFQGFALNDQQAARAVRGNERALFSVCNAALLPWDNRNITLAMRALKIWIWMRWVRRVILATRVNSA